MKILFVEDESELAEITRALLERERYVVDTAETVAIAKVMLLDDKYGLVLLDRRLPDGDGIELIRYAARKNIETRFLILSALGDLFDRVEGLDVGADDYIVKPFEPEELLARIRAASRRPLPETSKYLELGNLRLNCSTRNFRVAGETHLLPRRELVILETLLARAGRVVTRDTLESAMYGYDDEVQSNTLESHISRLRKHLSNVNSGVAIHTIRGVGYMLQEDGG